MKLLNKIVLLFLALCLLILYGGWRFIHSEKFSKDISIKVSKILTEKAGVKLDFSGVEFSLIPLATTFKNVKIEKKDPKLLNLNLVVESLEVSFTYSSFISSEPEIDEINLKNGTVKLSLLKKTNEEIVISELSTREIFIKYTELLSLSPVKLNFLILQNIDLSVDNVSMHVNQLSLSPHRKQLRLKSDIEKIDIAEEGFGASNFTIAKLKLLANFEKENWQIDKLSIEDSVNSIELTGNLYNRMKKLIVDSKGGLNGDVQVLLSKMKNVPAVIKNIKGQSSARFEISGVVDDPDFSMSINAKSVDTDWIKLEKFRAIIKKRKKNLLVQSLTATNGNELYQLKNPQVFFSFQSMKFTNFKFNFFLKEAFTNTFLYSIKNSLHTLKGHLTGDVEISLFDDKAVFNIKNRALIKSFRLTNADEKNDILKNPAVSLEETTIVINKDFSVEIDSKILMNNSRLLAKGKITEKGVDVNIRNSTIDMAYFGPISGIAISGSGPVDAKISGPFEDVVFDFDIDWNKFSVVDLNLGKVKSHFSLSLKEMQLEIASLDGVFNKSLFSASGTLDFQGESGMDLSIDFKNSSFSDAKKMFHLVFKNIKLPVEPEFNFTSSYTIKGGFDLESLRIDGQVKGEDLIVAREEAENISFKFLLNKKMLSFKQLKINKSRGEISSNINVNLNNNFIEMTGFSRGMRLRDLNTYRRLGLEYDGDLLIDFDGSGTTQDFNSKFKSRVVNAFIQNTPAASSNAMLYLNSNDVVINASLLGEKIKVDSLISFKTGIAAIKSSIETDDVREFLGFFAGHNMTEKGISGRIKAQLKTQISLGSLGVRRFYLDIEDLSFKKGDINVSSDPRYNKIEVEDGTVRKWDLRFTDGGEFFESKGENVSNGVIALKQRFALKASLLEILTSYVDKATGTIKGSNLVMLDKKFTIKDFILYGDDHSLKLKNLPGFIVDFNYSLVKKGEAFEIVKMSGKYGGGDFRVGGNIFFDDLYPRANIDYRIERSTIPLFKRSNLVLSSVGTITGTDLPYKLNGKVSLMFGEFLDDPADFMKEDKVTVDEYKKYLPAKDVFSKTGVLELNLSYETINPIVIKNNLAEVYVKGAGQITGNILSPEVNTRIEIVPNVSKFKFKGNDFALSQGYVDIQDKGKNRVSDLKFTGLTKINEYDMKLDLSGTISKINIDLSSEPALSKEDLLSLLTLGVTSDISKNLESQDRRFVTTVGMGALLVDQLKINEDLNATLGVKLSVAPEFKEDESTLIQGKSAVSEGSGSRLKSATKIKVNKKVNKRVDVSLSSTVGGSLEQKQEMNVNFNINKSFSLEGVYEVKPAEDENANTPNSLGADLKYRWSF